MDDPLTEIPNIVRTLCTSPLRTREITLRKYFVPHAQFIHPLCRTTATIGEVLGVYSWYQVLDPSVEVETGSIAFDEKNGRLYVDITQKFRVWIIPEFIYPRASYELVTVLDLEKHRDGKWYILRQNDLYQTDQWIAFIAPRFGRPLVFLITYLATWLCILGNIVSGPLRLRRGKLE